MTTQEARDLVERQARAWERGDAEAIVADFAPEGALISPGGRWQGHDDLRLAIAATFEDVTDVRIEVARVLLDGDEGAVEWTWSETRREGGLRRTVDDGIVFELDGGRISYWREYFDTAELERSAEG